MLGGESDVDVADDEERSEVDGKEFTLLDCPRPRFLPTPFTDMLAFYQRTGRGDSNNHIKKICCHPKLVKQSFYRKEESGAGSWLLKSTDLLVTTHLHT